MSRILPFQLNTDARGLATLVSEQVSHHPPITAYYNINRPFMRSRARPKHPFLGRQHLKQVGRATLSDVTKEDCSITHPRLRQLNPPGLSGEKLQEAVEHGK